MHNTNIDTAFLRRCLGALEASLEALEGDALKGKEAVVYDIYRAACIKEFELALEQGGKLLKKRLAAFFASNRQADRLSFRDLFRHAIKYGLIDPEVGDRWQQYRNSRNTTAHDYGKDFAENILKLLPEFIADAKALADTLEATNLRQQMMTERLRLFPRHRKMIEAIMREHVPGVEVWAYGSRVNGRGHDGSDLDLVLRTPNLESVDGSELADVKEALHDSTIPFLVEVHDWAHLPESFHREIERQYVVLVKGDSGYTAEHDTPAGNQGMEHSNGRSE